MVGFQWSRRAHRALPQSSHQHASREHQVHCKKKPKTTVLLENILLISWVLRASQAIFHVPLCFSLRKWILFTVFCYYVPGILFYGYKSWHFSLPLLQWPLPFHFPVKSAEAGTAHSWLTLSPRLISGSWLSGTPERWLWRGWAWTWTWREGLSVE